MEVSVSGSSLRVVNLTEVNPIDWNAFVANHPLGNVFQTWEMCEVYRHSDNNVPIGLAVEDGGILKGVLLAVIITNGGRLLYPLTARSIVYGGPLVADNNEEVLRLLLKAYKKQLPWYVVYSEIRPVYDLQSIENGLKMSGFERMGHYNLILSLKPSEEELLRAMHKKRRREINRSMEYGLVFRELCSDEEKSDAISLIKHTYERKHVPFSSSQTLQNLCDYLGGLTCFFGAFLNDKMIAAKIDLCYKNLVYAWFAGSDEKAFSYYPNDFLMWKLICWSKENGFEYLDFGGGGEPGVPYGVRDYKLKYGCELCDYGRFLIKHHPVVYRLGKFYTKIIIKR